MSIRDQRRDAAIDRMADHVLAVGLAEASLRALAAAVGTSDRMLLYYFADKNELLTATLERIAARLTAMLDAALPADARLPRAELLRLMWTAMTSVAVQPFMHVWLELAAGAARGAQPHRAIAGAIADGFATWIAAHLDAADADRPAAAARLLATVEGMLLLRALGRGDLAELAATAPAA